MVAVHFLHNILYVFLFQGIVVENGSGQWRPHFSPHNASKQNLHWWYSVRNVVMSTSFHSATELPFPRLHNNFWCCEVGETSCNLSGFRSPQDVPVGMGCPGVRHFPFLSLGSTMARISPWPGCWLHSICFNEDSIGTFSIYIIWPCSINSPQNVPFAINCITWGLFLLPCPLFTNPSNRGSRLRSPPTVESFSHSYEYAEQKKTLIMQNWCIYITLIIKQLNWWF